VTAQDKETYMGREVLSDRTGGEDGAFCLSETEMRSVIVAVGIGSNKEGGVIDRRCFRFVKCPSDPAAKCEAHVWQSGNTLSEYNAKSIQYPSDLLNFLVTMS
jgi:hypothetical protein